MQSRNSHEKAQKKTKNEGAEIVQSSSGPRVGKPCHVSRPISRFSSRHKASVSPINFPFVFFLRFLRLFLPFSAFTAIPLVLGVVR
jgi:hypothetical protein